MKTFLAIIAAASIVLFAGCDKIELTDLDAKAQGFLEDKLADPHLLEIKWKKEGSAWQGTITPTDDWSGRNQNVTVSFPLFIEIDKNLEVTGYM